MTISREEIQRVRELAENCYKGRLNCYKTRRRELGEEWETIMRLCDTAERGAEVTVTDEMVEVADRARQGYLLIAASGGTWKGAMRAALEAALTHRPTPEEAGK